METKTLQTQLTELERVEQAEKQRLERFLAESEQRRKALAEKIKQEALQQEIKQKRTANNEQLERCKKLAARLNQAGVEYAKLHQEFIDNLSGLNSSHFQWAAQRFDASDLPLFWTLPDGRLVAGKPTLRRPGEPTGLESYLEAQPNE